MFARVLRAALFCATLLVAWTIARPALAAPAPFCDDRGATALAAPPVLEAPDEAIRRTRVAECNRDTFEVNPLLASLGPTRGAPAATADDAGHACLAAGVAQVPASPATLLVVEPADRPSVGARARVERPPRG